MCVFVVCDVIEKNQGEEFETEVSSRARVRVDEMQNCLT